MNPQPTHLPRNRSGIRDGGAASAQASVSPDRARLDHVVAAALRSLGGGAAGAFLNRHHHGLAGRPLDLAVASEAGLAAVETAICVEARRGLESC